MSIQAAQAEVVDSGLIQEVCVCSEDEAMSRMAERTLPQVEVRVRAKAKRVSPAGGRKVTLI